MPFSMKLVFDLMGEKKKKRKVAMIEVSKYIDSASAVYARTISFFCKSLFYSGCYFDMSEFVCHAKRMNLN